MFEVGDVGPVFDDIAKGFNSLEVILLSFWGV
jgi:hypothetical protein